MSTPPGSTDSRKSQLWLIPRAGESARGPVADVAVHVRSRRPYSYAVPADLAERVAPGVWVEVPFGKGRREVVGVCVSVSDGKWDHSRKAITGVLPLPPLLDAHLVELALWLADYYFCSLDLVFDALVPARARRVSYKKVGYLQHVGDAKADRLTDKQRRLLETLADGPRPQAEALAAAEVGAGVATGLRQRGLVERVEREEPQTPAVPALLPTPPAPVADEDDYLLTEGQQRAVDRIAAVAEAGCWRVFALFGVPGSGKTEVYVRAIKRVLATGRQAIMLVPEIALATQLVQRLARRFARVAILHSGLTDRQRTDTLRRIADDQIDVVIGTRSAVFAPCRRLGLIVVDEEQEGSLKNLAAPFFHARDVSIKRGQLLGIPVVLGSATPSLETWHNAKQLPHYELLELPQRVPGAELPQTELVPYDAREADRVGAMLSPKLAHRLRDVVAAGRQAILLHNRRGYAIYLRCDACGMIVSCPRCAAHMVVHHGAGGERADSYLVCHQCNHRRPDVPTRCENSTCGGVLVRSGLAIQRLEETLKKLLPNARLLRLDSDAMKRRDDYRDALQRFEAGEADILLGTQMVAKGLDFPEVELVGVIDADAGLWLPDFRAGERVFQLLMQVCGRAGRKAGASLALVQSAIADAPAVRFALAMDYPSFAAIELKSRDYQNLPPTTRLVRLVLSDQRPGRARREALALARELRRIAQTAAPSVRIDEPAACVITRLREMLRYEILLRGPRDASVQRLLSEAEQQKALRPKVHRLTIDVDALDLM